MPDRILDFTDSPARLKVRLSQLVAIREGEADRTFPLEEIAAVVVSNVGVTYTNAVLEGLAKAGALLVVCDGKQAPAAMLLPLAGNTLQAERFAAQAAAPLPMKKRLWQSIVKAKIGAQARLLRELRGDDAGLGAMLARVRSGDPDNLEAQAARRYWPALFADPAFRRDPDGGGVNSTLNYGYAVLRAAVARSLCASGLHPTLGLHHHNRYNPFCLADDLMEPFRPVVDRAAVAILAELGPSAGMGREVKARILAPFAGQLDLRGERRTLFDCLARLAASLAAAYMDGGKGLILPDSVWVLEDEAHE